MKIKPNQSNFEPCPEYTGSAVCVDVTPLKKQQSQFGEREVFKLVFETQLTRPDGSRYLVWSLNFTPSLHEKSNFRKFLRGWFGRDLTKAEMDDFETESLLGRTGQTVIVHEYKDDVTYANIAVCTPDKSPEPMKASEKYVRVKDRPPKGGANQQGGYKSTEQPAAKHGPAKSVRVHVGRCKGIDLLDLSKDQMQALVDNWLPTAKANPKPSADDRRLIDALEFFASADVESDTPPTDEDDLNY